jgi:hypothetical protein
MTTDPTPSPAAGPLVRFVAESRSSAAWLLAVIAAACLAVGGYLAYSVWSTPKPAAEAQSKEGEPPPVTPTVEGPNREARLIGAVGGFAGGLSAAVLAVVLAVGLPSPTAAGRATDARGTILAVGGILGLILMLVGAALLFIPWFEPLSRWVADKTPPKDAWKPITAILISLGGAGLMFLAAQPARAEERNNPFLRRLVYGSNFALTVLLLGLVLVVGNVFAGLKIPNKLDTTQSGFYTLSDQTRRYLAELSQPVKAYSTFTDDTSSREVNDVRRLLQACQEAAPTKFQVRTLNPVTNREEIKSLRTRFPQADLTDYGVLLTTGEDEKNYTFIRGSDFFEQNFDRGVMGGASLTFVGESKLARELLFLGENKNRATVYFTTGHGEPEVVPGFTPPGEVKASGRSANQLRTALEKGNVDAKPLSFDLKDPRVPDDAAVVAVIDPRAAFSEAEVSALRKYLTEDRGGKKGKLIVASSPFPKADGRGVGETGLEPLLAEFGVRLGMEYLLSQPARDVAASEALAGVNAALLDSGNPIATDFGSRPPLFPNPREVGVLPAPPGGSQPTAEVLFATYPASRITWLEPDPVANPAKAFADMLESQDLLTAKKASRRTRSIGVLVSEGNKGRLAVYGSGEAFADPDRRRGPQTQDAAELFAATVNWLRDRPDVANIANKPYSTYQLSRGADSIRLLWLPWASALLGVLALGLGVWVFRRK